MPRSYLGPNPLYVDPADVSGHASDTNPGSSSAAPIASTARVNELLENVQIDASTFLRVFYLSDDASGTPLNLNRTCVGGALYFYGAPHVVRQGTLTAGTVGRNVATQRRDQVEDASLLDWSPYANMFLTDTAAGVSCAIVKALPGAASTAYVSSPVDDSLGDFAPGVLASGDGYDVSHGSQITLGDLTFAAGSTFPDVEFFDFDLLSGPTSGALLVTYRRCRPLAQLPQSAATFLFVNCILGAHSDFDNWYSPASGFDIFAGLYVTKAQDGGFYLSLFGNVYVTGVGLYYGTLGYLVGDAFGGPGWDAAVQLQDCTSPLGAMWFTGVSLDLNASVLGDGTSSPGPIWGNGNAGAGLAFGPSSSVRLAAGTMTATGAGGDFAFPGAAAPTTGRPWVETLGGYGPAESCTWGNLDAAGDLHANDTGAHAIAIAS